MTCLLMKLYRNVINWSAAFAGTGVLAYLLQPDEKEQADKQNLMVRRGDLVCKRWSTPLF